MPWVNNENRPMPRKIEELYKQIFLWPRNRFVFLKRFFHAVEKSKIFFPFSLHLRKVNQKSGDEYA